MTLSGVAVMCSAGDGNATDNGPAQLDVHPVPGVVTITVDTPKLDVGGSVSTLAPRLQYDPPSEDNGMERSDDLYPDAEDDEGYGDECRVEVDRGSCRDRSCGGRRPA